MIRVTGWTWDHRDYLKSLRMQFDPSDKSWSCPSVSEADLAKLRKLVGVQVVGDTIRPVVSNDELAELIAPFTRQRDKSHVRNGQSATYGDDDTWLNYFADQNPTAFFGFSSLATMIDYVVALRRPGRGRDDGWLTSMGGWYGTPSMDQAVNIARTGWREGLDDVPVIDVPPATRKRRQGALAGGSVNVGKMLSGNPEHMVRRPRLPGQRIVTLFVESFMSASISPDNAIKRAKCCAAISDAMEREGYSCEIVAIVTTLGTDKTTGHQLACTLKRAGERLNLADVVFGLGHPSFFRRLVFACVGAANECRTTHSTQGMPTAAFNADHPTRLNEFYIKQLAMSSQRHITDELSVLPFIRPEGLPL